MKEVNDWFNAIGSAAIDIITSWPLVASAVCLYVTWLFLSRKHHGHKKPTRCAACDYPIDGLTKPLCPECGADLAARGVRRAEYPRRGEWFGLQFTWALVCIALALVCCGPLVRQLPQTYETLWYATPAYVEGERGRRVHVTIKGHGLGWPLRSTVTGRAELVQIDTSTWVRSYSRADGLRTIQWRIAENKVEQINYNTSRRGTVSGPLTEDIVLRHLQAAGEPAPKQTAQRIMDMVHEHRKTATRKNAPRVFRVKPGEAYSTAAPINPHAAAIVAAWVWLGIWAASNARLFYEWRNSGRIDWQPPETTDT